MICYAQDKKDVAAIWVPDVKESVIVAVCAEHAAAAAKRQIGVVTRLKHRGAYSMPPGPIEG
jgi:hypothetical protein